MLLGIQRCSLVQVLRYPHIETPLERHIRRLTLSRAEGKILINRAAEVLLDFADTRAIVKNHVPEPKDAAVQEPVFGAVLDRSVVSIVGKCLAHSMSPCSRKNSRTPRT